MESRSFVSECFGFMFMSCGQAPVQLQHVSMSIAGPLKIRIVEGAVKENSRERDVHLWPGCLGGWTNQTKSAPSYCEHRRVQQGLKSSRIISNRRAVHDMRSCAGSN